MNFHFLRPELTVFMTVSFRINFVHQSNLQMTWTKMIGYRHSSPCVIRLICLIDLPVEACVHVILGGFQSLVQFGASTYCFLGNSIEVIWIPHTLHIVRLSVTGEFPSQRPVTQIFDLSLNQRLSKQSWGWWFEMPSRSLWRHCNDLDQRHPSDWLVVSGSWAPFFNQSYIQQTQF